ncbi:Phosphate acyltransferase [Oligella ureolytica]
MIKIAIDCMGGDDGLAVTIPGTVSVANRYPDTHFLLVGLVDQIEAALERAKPNDRSQFEIVSATEVVTMDDPVEVALRRKKDSSMRVAISCVKNGDADACVSSGNTGALMALSRFILKMLPGVLIVLPLLQPCLMPRVVVLLCSIWALTLIAVPSICSSLASWVQRWYKLLTILRVRQSVS